MKKFAVLTSLWFAACLPNPGGLPVAPECHVDADCPVAGEVCDEGLCWGDPPPGMYAALIAPPASTHDLVVTEVPDLAIPFDGDVGNQIIQAPVQIGGRVHLSCQAPAPVGCDPTAAVGATITVVRPSRIPGGPLYVDSTTSDASSTSGDSFTLDVPRLALDEPAYTMTVRPDDSSPVSPNGPTAAMLAPPITSSVDATDSVVGMDVALGSGYLRVVTGRVIDATGAGAAGVKVSAMGHFDANRPAERVSTVAVTDLTGYYTIYVAQNAMTGVEVIGAPADKPGMTLRLVNVPADLPQQSVIDLKVPATGKSITVILPVVGHNSAGVATPVPGATVDVTTTLLNDGREIVTHELTTSTDAHGNATLSLVPQSGTSLREYTVRINPAPTSEFASVYGQSIDIGTGSGVLGELDLPHRVPVTGTLYDADGNPAPGVTVTAAPSLSLTLGLDVATQTILSSLQSPTTTTAADGSFSVYVDPDLAGNAGVYDVQCVPPAGARVPRWTSQPIYVKNAIDAVPMGDIRLPRGRHIRGRVVHGTTAVTGAEVRIYEIGLNATACMNAPGTCVVPATLRAVDQSDTDGKVRFVLPDTRP
jgi:hypothetical protein